MRLLTHNLLQCHVKNCTNNYPLRVESAELESLEIEYNEEFLKNVLWSKIDWKVLKDTAFDLGLVELPETLPNPPTEGSADGETITPELMQTIHKLLLETKIKEGKMVCDGCKHVYEVKDGIANMLLSENEV